MHVFPSNPQTPHFVCAPPSGPFLAGFSPFFPFNGSECTYDLNQQQTHTPAPAPLRSFRPQQSNGDVVRNENGDGSSSQMRQKRSAARPKAAVEKKLKLDDYYGLGIQIDYAICLVSCATGPTGFLGQESEVSKVCRGLQSYSDLMVF